jgi:hypothetical protein
LLVGWCVMGGQGWSPGIVGVRCPAWCGAVSALGAVSAFLVPVPVVWLRVAAVPGCCLRVLC